MMLKEIWCENVGDSSGSEYRPGASFCKRGNESSGSIKEGNFLDG
jgi:hypothetical protein